jgi:hypothetical protein
MTRYAVPWQYFDREVSGEHGIARCVFRFVDANTVHQLKFPS